jgi:integrase
LSGHSQRTLCVFLAAITAMHDYAEYPDPTYSLTVERFRALPFYPSNRQTTDLTAEAVRAVLSTKGGDRYSVRAKALITLAFALRFTLTELTLLRIEHCIEVKDELFFDIVPAKAGGKSRARFISRSEVERFSEWLSLRGSAPGFVFNRLNAVATEEGSGLTVNTMTGLMRASMGRFDLGAAGVRSLHRASRRDTKMRSLGARNHLNRFGRFLGLTYQRESNAHHTRNETSAMQRMCEQRRSVGEAWLSPLEECDHE